MSAPRKLIGTLGDKHFVIPVFEIDSVPSLQVRRTSVEFLPLRHHYRGLPRSYLWRDSDGLQYGFQTKMCLYVGDRQFISEPLAQWLDLDRCHPFTRLDVIDFLDLSDRRAAAIEECRSYLLRYGVEQADDWAVAEYRRQQPANEN